MLFLLSPAKTLDYESPVPDVPHTLPAFTEDSVRLIEVLRRKSPQQLSSLMEISDALAGLNAARYQAWTPKFTARNSRQAVLAFDGDVYDGLQARQLAPADLEWAQQHLRILSGLYGVLRPLDWMQPYRLEMGTALKVGTAGNLYQHWGSRISEHLNELLAADKTPVVINLASQEYSRAVDRRALKARIIDCVFEEWRGDGWKVISFSAKKARGLMARYAITKRLETPRKLENFNLEGYAFDASASQAERLVFRRRTAA
ncbi:MAG TPA: peroxide stress protein YaaA [Ramlibacter sp.]|uniref:peroxide stress protein YaaA n=1 Tax=Ramlibacter sp. TaxID=1917967 RepID=UPI002ED20F36